MRPAGQIVGQGFGRTLAGYREAVTEETLARVDRTAQAMGIVSVQADCTLGDALGLMADRANVQHQTLDEIATAVVTGAIRFCE